MYEIQPPVIFRVACADKRVYHGIVKKMAGPISRVLTIFSRPERHPNEPAGEEGSFSAERERMVRDQLMSPAYHVTDPRVLAAMSEVPRHRFVPADIRHRAYEDCALPIGHGQTISQPFIVAFMTVQLDPQPTDRVLEIGAGSGYQAAVLAKLVKEVYTIEIVGDLAQRAGSELRQLGYTNVQVRSGDGYQGWPEAAPFDAIIVACAPQQVPQPLVEQLKPGGRMIIPIGPEWDQTLVLLHKEGERLVERATLPVRFVPMTGRALERSG